MLLLMPRNDPSLSPIAMLPLPVALGSALNPIATLYTSSYAVSLDGRRFLRAQPPESGQAATKIQVVFNWSDELKRRVAPSGT